MWFFFFFSSRRRHTRSLRDWSSDVCSSDLDGSIWRSTGQACNGSSCPGWQKLDDNPAATAIASAGKQLFQLHNDGSIWRSTGVPCNGAACGGWQQLDNNPAATGIAAYGNSLFQLHN